MLIFNRFIAPSAWLPAAFIVAAFALPVTTVIAAHADADTLIVGGCVAAPGALNCVARVGPAGNPYIRVVPPPDSDAEKERAEARDKKWIERCRPVIAQDRFGVARYRYSATGCDFGIIQ